MTEPLPAPPPETHEEPPLLAKRPIAPWLYGTGFLVLAVAIAWVWHRPVTMSETEARQMAALQAQIARMEQAPVPQTADLGPLAARVTALEQRPISSGGSADLAPLTARVAALEQRKTPDLAPVEARVAALEAKQQTDNQLIARIDALSARVESLDTAQRTTRSEFDGRIGADEGRLSAIERNSSRIAGLIDRANRLARIQSAQMALDQGQALGDIADAPPPLARFATAKPPTEASLRLGFPPAARAALSAARPATEGKPVLTRLWAQAQELITVREGDRVLVGDPTAGLLERARAALDAGDLAGAVAIVGSLTGPAADAMAAWLAQARALLDARGALAEWAARG